MGERVTGIFIYSFHFPSGTPVNEIHTPEFILGKLAEIKAIDPDVTIEIEHQKLASGFIALPSKERNVEGVPSKEPH